MAVLGFDLQPLRSAITDLGQSIRNGAQQGPQAAQGGDYLGYLSGIAQPSPGPSGDLLSRVAQPTSRTLDFMGQLQAYAGQAGGLGGAAFNLLGNLYPGGSTATPGSQQTWNDLNAFGDYKATQAQAAAAATGQNTGTGSVPKPGPAPTSGGATYTNLDPNVAKWADQTNQTFGDQGGWVPAAMLAIIQHESSGDPNIQNRGGYPAYGLFQLWQQPGLTADQQFQAARALAQQKLKSIQDAYAANGLNPDERTRARDLFLAWAGHFDYGTGQPNAGSRDIGSGEDANAFLNGPRGIMPMYDNIVKGRQQASAPAGGAWGANLIGTPYVAGGLRAHPNAPQQGLDCSEFTAYVWGQQGVALPMNANAQYQGSAPVNFNDMQPGDLVFFAGTDPSDPDPITHVGIYVGMVNGKPTMINAQDNGVQYADLTSPYWQQHYAASGRVKR